MSAFWDGKFSGDAYAYGTAPNAHLLEQADHLSLGAKVLVPGDGEGRNGVWLARQGMDVLSVDGSAVGLDKARRIAAASNVPLKTQQADLLEWDWPEAAFDGVVSIFLHFSAADRPRMHAAMAAALRPGGILILEAFRPDQLRHSSGGPKDPDLLYRAEDLRADFAGLRIDLLEEVDCILDEGPLHQGPAATVRLIAHKPSETA